MLVLLKYTLSLFNIITSSVLCVILHVTGSYYTAVIPLLSIKTVAIPEEPSYRCNSALWRIPHLHWGCCLKPNLGSTLILLSSRRISPDPSAGTLAIPLTCSFLLLHTGISHRLFLKLPICSDSSWDSRLVFFLILSRLPLSIAHVLCDQISRLL